MNRTVLVALALLAGACHDPAKGRWRVERIPAPSLLGSRLGNAADHPALVYLPPGYDSGTGRYPVVYYLAGFGTPATDYLDQSFQGLNVQLVMDDLIHLGRVRPMILVFLDGRSTSGGVVWTDSPVTGRFEEFVARDAVSWVDGRYRTLADPGARGLAGDAVGGAGALAVAMRRSGRFGAVYAISPALFPSPEAARAFLLPDARVQQDLVLLRELRAVPEAEARRRFEEALGSMLHSRQRDDQLRGFAWLYAAAYAPDPGARVPWVRYPVTAGGALDADALGRLEAGFGALDQKVHQLGDNLRALHGLVLDYGRRDQFRWLPEGCERFSALLREAGIEHELRAHGGSHQGSLRFRIEYQMLPFFSERLAR